MRRMAAVMSLVLVGVACSPSAADEPLPARSAGCDAPDASAVSDTATFDHDGVTRPHRLYAPAAATADPPEPVPLVVDMHGAGGNAEQQEQMSGLRPIAEREGFAVLTPQAGDEERNSWFLDPDGDDVAYLTALLDDVEATVCIDPRRVYLTGFSQGGMLALILGCEDPARFAAVAPVAGTVEVDGCDRDSPVPLIAFHGSADTDVGFDGHHHPVVEAMVGYARGPSVTDLTASWAEDNGCDVAGTEREEPPDRRVVDYDCPGAPVELHVVEGGGHGWPPGAGEQIWAFFDAQARR